MRRLRQLFPPFASTNEAISLADDAEPASAAAGHLGGSCGYADAISAELLVQNSLVLTA